MSKVNASGQTSVEKGVTLCFSKEGGEGVKGARGKGSKGGKGGNFRGCRARRGDPTEAHAGVKSARQQQANSSMHLLCNICSRCLMWLEVE